jgi:tetratricopeptide (TPR) repeat protein
LHISSRAGRALTEPWFLLQMEALLDGLIMDTVISGLSPRAEGVDHEDEGVGAIGEADTAPAHLVSKHLLGQRFLSGGDARGAVEEWETCLAEARLLQLDNAEGVISANLGIAYHSLGEMTLTIQRLTRAVAVARRLCDRAAEGRRLSNLGSAYMSYSQQMRNTTTDTSGQPLAMSQHQHQLAKAVRLFQQALDISRELGDRTVEARRLGNLGIAFRCTAAAASVDEQRQALARLAVQHDTDAVTICREIGDRRNECRRLGNLGTAYDILGQVAEAVHHHTAALSIARELGDRRYEGRILSNLGNVYYNHPDFESNISPTLGERAQVLHYREALAILTEVGDERGAHNLRHVMLSAQGREDVNSEEPEPNAESEHERLVVKQLAQARQDLRCHQLKMEHDAAEMSHLRQRRAEIDTRLARKSGDQPAALAKEAVEEARQQQGADGSTQQQQALDIARWVAAAAENEVRAGDARPRAANLYAAQSSMERMDDLVEAAEAATRGQLIAVTLGS